MTPIAIVSTAALALAATLLSVPTRAAESDRVYVASYGSDSNPCTVQLPCETFEQAVKAVAVDGEVDAIDSAGFGPVTIKQSVTIASLAGTGASIQAAPGGNAITINAPGANVTLRGLTLEGAGVAYNGIVFNSGDSLTVINCEAQNFIHNDSASGNGILMQPSSGAVSFMITNTNVSNNGFSGIRYTPPRDSTATANGVIYHVVAANNQFGILISNRNATVAISDAITSSGP
jgi:hypothetical protein